MQFLAVEDVSYSEVCLFRLGFLKTLNVFFRQLKQRVSSRVAASPHYDAALKAVADFRVPTGMTAGR